MFRFSIFLIAFFMFAVVGCDDSSDNDDSVLDSDVAVEDADAVSVDEDVADDTDVVEDGDAVEDEDVSVNDDDAAAGCVEIEVPTITSSGYSDEISGFFTPAMGGDVIDIVKIILSGEIKTGTYDLGSDVNLAYETCTQCVSVWVDVENFNPVKAYYQVSGNFVITDVSGEGVDLRTNGYMEDVKLVKSSFPEFVPEDVSDCVHIAYAEWQTIK